MAASSSSSSQNSFDITNLLGVHTSENLAGSADVSSKPILHWSVEKARNAENGVLSGKSVGRYYLATYRNNTARFLRNSKRVWFPVNTPNRKTGVLPSESDFEKLVADRFSGKDVVYLGTIPLEQALSGVTLKYTKYRNDEIESRLLGNNDRKTKIAVYVAMPSKVTASLLRYWNIVPHARDLANLLDKTRRPSDAALAQEIRTKILNVPGYDKIYATNIDAIINRNSWTYKDSLQESVDSTDLKIRKRASDYYEEAAGGITEVSASVSENKDKLEEALEKFLICSKLKSIRTAEAYLGHPDEGGVLLYKDGVLVSGVNRMAEKAILNFLAPSSTPEGYRWKEPGQSIISISIDPYNQKRSIKHNVTHKSSQAWEEIRASHAVLPSFVAEVKSEEGSKTTITVPEGFFIVSDEHMSVRHKDPKTGILKEPYPLGGEAAVVNVLNELNVSSDDRERVLATVRPRLAVLAAKRAATLSKKRTGGGSRSSSSGGNLVIRK